MVSISNNNESFWFFYRISTRTRLTEKRCTCGIYTSCTLCTCQLTTSRRQASHWSCMQTLCSGAVGQSSRTRWPNRTSLSGTARSSSIIRSSSTLTRARLVSRSWNISQLYQLYEIVRSNQILVCSQLICKIFYILVIFEVSDNIGTIDKTVKKRKNNMVHSSSV